MPSVILDTGVALSGIKAGMAEMRSEVGKAQRDITSELGKAIVAGGLASYLDQVIEKAHEIHHQAERFGVDAQFLQIASNAAKEDGVQLNSVARAMNQLEINTQKARDGNEKAAHSFEVLGINIDDVRKLSPEQLFMRIADGVKNADDRTAAYAAVAALLGARMGTELIPTLEKGSDAIRQIGTDMGVMSDSTLENLDKIRKEWVDLKNVLTVGMGGALAWLVKAWKAAVAGFATDMMILKDVVVGNFEIINRAFHFDFKGASRELKTMIDNVRGDVKTGSDYLDELYGSPASTGAAHGPGSRHIGLDASEANTDSSGAVRTSSRSSSDSSGDSVASMQARLNKLNEESLQRTLPAEENLNRLQERRNALLKQAEAQSMHYPVDSDENHAKSLRIQLDLAENQKEIDKASKVVAAENAQNDKERAKAQADLLAAREKAAAQAALETAAETERNQQLRDTMQFGSEIAGQMAEQRKLQSEINDVTDRINQAWSEGDQTLAAQLTTLRDQLETEKALTVEVQRRAAAEREALVAQRAAAANAKTWKDGLQDFANNAAGYSSEQLYAISQGREEYLARIRQFANQLDVVRTGADRGQMRMPTPQEVAAFARNLNPAFYAMEQTLSNQDRDRATIGAAQRILNSADQRRSVADEIAYLQNTAIPGLQALIRPDEPFQIVKFLQDQLDTLRQQLDELKQLTAMVKGPPGTGGGGGVIPTGR